MTDEWDDVRFGAEYRLAWELTSRLGADGCGDPFVLSRELLDALEEEGYIVTQRIRSYVGKRMNRHQARARLIA